MFDDLIDLAEFGNGYAGMLMADIDADRFNDQPVEGMNSPAWIVGHLAFVADRVAGLLGDQPQLADWEPMFGGGSPPAPDRSSCPSKDELVAAWQAAHGRLVAAVRAADPVVFAGENPVQRMREVAPTFGHFVAFVLSTHAAVHLGQLSAWRRAAGRPALF